MEHGAEPTPALTYEVLLAHRPPDSLRDLFPTMSIEATRAHTALRRRVSGPAQLDTLLEKLCLLGLPLLDVHRLPGVGGEGGGHTFEVRVDAVLGGPLLRYLSWTPRVVPGRTRVRIVASPGELHEFLRACTGCGAGIERVRRVRPARERQQAGSAARSSPR